MTSHNAIIRFEKNDKNNMRCCILFMNERMPIVGGKRG